MAEQINITEWLAKAKEEPKEAAQPIIVFFGLIFLVYRFLYSPKVAELEVEDRKNTRVKRDIDRVARAGENIEDIQLEIEEMRENWRKAREMCYKKSEITAYMRRIRELAQKAGISVRNVNPVNISQQRLGEISAERMPVSLFFSGDLVKLGIFLRLLETEEKIKFITLPPLLANASGTFDFDLSPATILIPDELANE